MSLSLSLRALRTSREVSELFLCHTKAKTIPGNTTVGESKEITVV
jgi:hypothetical protein